MFEKISEERNSFSGMNWISTSYVYLYWDAQIAKLSLTMKMLQNWTLLVFDSTEGEANSYERNADQDSTD